MKLNCVDAIRSYGPTQLLSLVHLSCSVFLIFVVAFENILCMLSLYILTNFLAINFLYPNSSIYLLSMCSCSLCVLVDLTNLFLTYILCKPDLLMLKCHSLTITLCTVCKGDVLLISWC